MEQQQKKESKQSEKPQYIRAYAAMVLSRTLDKKIVSAQRQGRVGFYTPTMGQEALQVGVSMALEKEDLVYGYYRDVPMMLHRGVPIETIINQIMGNSADTAKGRQMPSHYTSKALHFMSVQSPVASNLPLAAGAAYALKYRQKKNVVVTTFGDGATSTPDFHAGMNLAAVFKLPLVFVCENNGWAISLPVERQTPVEISLKASAYGMPGVKADGMNFVEMYKVARAAIQDARAGKGPTLIDALSYRMGPHSTSDDPTKYRKDDVKEGSEKDPLVIGEKLLISMDYADDKLLEKIRNEAVKTVDERFDACEKIPPPDPITAFQDVYKNMTWMLEEEVKDIL
ncbi:MAG: thiamine pyrophosphate-dependent dehydrogenase E1 component subunit alpha [Thermoplasmataceae archaeon]|jgi:pyruvate dehydrogenase E1 component alpha subunit